MEHLKAGKEREGREGRKGREHEERRGKGGKERMVRCTAPHLHTTRCRQSTFVLPTLCISIPSVVMPTLSSAQDQGPHQTTNTHRHAHTYA